MCKNYIVIQRIRGLVSEVRAAALAAAHELRLLEAVPKVAHLFWEPALLPRLVGFLLDMAADDEAYDTVLEALAVAADRDLSGYRGLEANKARGGEGSVAQDLLAAILELPGSAARKGAAKLQARLLESS